MPENISELCLLRDRVKNALVNIGLDLWEHNLGASVEELALRYVAVEQDRNDTVKILDKTRERLRAAEEVLLKVESWANAYPLEVFPKPDAKKCAELLKSGGESIDNLCAYAHRGSIDWIASDVRSYLADHKKDGQI